MFDLNESHQNWLEHPPYVSYFKDNIFYLSVMSRRSRVPFDMIVLFEGRPADWLSYQQNGKQKDDRPDQAHFKIL